MSLNKDELRLIYINKLGLDSNNQNVYEFIFSYNADEAFGYNWESIPVCNINSPLPEDEYVGKVYKLKTDVLIDCAQENCCYSYQDCKDRVYAIGSENLNALSEYPKYRLILMYGETYNEVCLKLSNKNLFFDYDEK